MEYHEAASTLFDLRRFTPRPGTAATDGLLDELGDPHEGVPCVQVAGSNGKGSTARMLESVCREAGLDVGLYTSPHLDDLRDRVRVNGRPMSEGALVAYVEAVGPSLETAAADGDSPTFFETVTAMALWEFGRRDVDLAVLEVGIGGTHDATSVVDPIAAAVTGVSLEHTDVLGDDVATIARDIAGVAPADRPLVTGATGAALDAVRETVGDCTVIDIDGAEADVVVRSLGRDGPAWRVGVDGSGIELETSLPLLGDHQARNAGVATALAGQVADALDLALDAATAATGLRTADWPGRFEVMGREPLVVLDGAHNPPGCAALARTLSTFEYDDLHLVAGAMADKDHRGMARALPDPTRVIASQPDRDRAEAEGVLARAFEAETAATVETRADVAGALADALAAAEPDDCVLVAGSLYAVAEARTRWDRPVVPRRVDSLATARETLEDANVTAAGTWRMRGKAVHRVLRTRVQPRQARYLKEELLSLGGECAVSGLVDQREERVEVAMMGTLAQFRRLTEKLDGQPYGLAPLGAQIRETLGFGSRSVRSDRSDSGDRSDGDAYPWTGDRTAVMGVLNVTPDSFHDGGQFDATEDAIARAREMVDAGAAIVDVGGESTRPGADPVPVGAEIGRVRPVLQATADLDATVSIDTRKPAVARAALEAGADVVNDVTGLADPEMRAVAAEFDAPVVVMHSIEAPVVPGRDVHYDDVVGDVLDALSERVLLAERAGLDRSQILVDPGLGFGKAAAESFELLDRLGEFRALGCPILVGHSHKSMYGLIGRGPDERRDPTVAATALAAERGADVVRVHDVAANVDAVDTVAAARDPDAFVEEE
jgi:dihydropteroate synthase